MSSNKLYIWQTRSLLEGEEREEDGGGGQGRQEEGGGAQLRRGGVGRGVPPQFCGQEVRVQSGVLSVHFRKSVTTTEYRVIHLP